jgi:hypothetical protein
MKCHNDFSPLYTSLRGQRRIPSTSQHQIRLSCGCEAPTQAHHQTHEAPASLQWQYLPHPFIHVNSPLQPHPNIAYIPQSQLDPVNDGCGENPNQSTFGISNWPRSHKKPPMIIISPIATYTNSFVQYQQPIEIKSSSLKLSANEKGKQPLAKYFSIESS